MMWVAGWASKACVGLLDCFSVNVAISDHTVTAYPICTYDSLVGRTGNYTLQPSVWPYIVW